MVEFRPEDFSDDSQPAMRSKQANDAAAAATTADAADVQLSLMNTHGISKQSKACSPTGTFLPAITPLVPQ